MKKKEVLWDATVLLLGAVLFGMGFRMFLLPNAIVLGGSTGLATVINRLFGLPVGLVGAAINLPLLLLCFCLRGKEGVVRALLGILAVSAASDAFFFLPTLTDELLIAAAFGGALTGLGIAVAFLRGFTSGGSDLAAYLLRRHFPRISMGGLVLVIDGCIILLSALIFRDFSSIFYSAVAAISFSFVLDFTLSRSRRARLALVVCPRSDFERLAEAVSQEMRRGITHLPAVGFYTGEGRELLLCAVRPAESERLTLLVRRHAPDAFLVFLAAPEVFGFRFSVIGG